VSHAAGSPGLAANDSSNPISISPDGRFVVFGSRATDLVPQPIDQFRSAIFVYDRLSGTNALVSRSVVTPPGDVPWWWGRPSPDARYIPFLSDANDLVPGQTDPGTTQSVFLFDQITGTTELISHATGSPAAEANDRSESAAVSPDGRYVAFRSLATDLVAGLVDTNGHPDLFLYDRATGTTTLLSRNAAGMPANRPSGNPIFAAGGRCLVFVSEATDLVPGFDSPDDWWPDVFLYSFESGTISVISQAHGAVALSNGASYYPSVSADCSAVAFTSEATNLVPGQPADQTADLFLREPRRGTTTQLGRTNFVPDSFYLPPQAEVSADGRFVAFEAIDYALVPGQEQRSDPNVFLFDRLTRGFLLASGAGGSPTRPANSGSFPYSLSADGRAVVFWSGASDLAVGDFNGKGDIFLFSHALEGIGLFLVSPCRLFDTRRPEDGPALASHTPTFLDVDGGCGIPATARALVLSVTVVQPTGTGFLTLYPGDAEPPVASTVNFAAGAIRTNNAIVPLALDGTQSLGLRAIVAGNGTVHVVVDVAGYFE